MKTTINEFKQISENINTGDILIKINKIELVNYTSYYNHKMGKREHVSTIEISKDLKTVNNLDELIDDIKLYVGFDLNKSSFVMRNGKITYKQFVKDLEDLDFFETKEEYELWKNNEIPGYECNIECSVEILRTVDITNDENIMSLLQK